MVGELSNLSVQHILSRVILVHVCQFFSQCVFGKEMEADVCPDVEG